MFDLIRKAVELADGFEERVNPFDDHNDKIVDEEPSQVHLDALAAQLVRQVDALENADPPISVSVKDGYTSITWHYPCRCSHACNEEEKDWESPDRTINTIKAIVESGVLE